MITIEDVNSIMNTYSAKLVYHTINTNLIGTHEFEDVKYDFCIVGHSINGNSHTYTFEIVNSYWSKRFAIYHDGNYRTYDFDWDYDDETGILTITCDYDYIELELECAQNQWIMGTPFIEKFLDGNVLKIDYNELGDTVRVYYKELDTDMTYYFELTLQKGWNQSSFPTERNIYSFVRKLDVNFILERNVKLIQGKMNTVKFTTNNGITGKCKVEYLDKSTEFNLSDGEFNVDLTDYDKNTNLPVKIKIMESDIILGKTLDFKLEVDYVTVDNFSNFINEILSGTKIISLSGDFELLSNVTVNHDLLIVGNDYNVDCKNYCFTVAEDCNLKINNLRLVNGNPVFNQLKGSILDLTGCTFTNAKNTQYNNLGSVINCDIDIDSLEITDDFTTNINKCLFVNNHNCILHGGTLNITDSKYHNTDMSFVDINNPAFLYQVDGEATITESVFDIDYNESEDFEENNIMYGQALFMCGETAIINNAGYDDLSKNNNVNWSNSPYMNLSHLYCKYYYPQIEEVVYSSPVVGQEDKNLAYAVSGKDFVFKSNTQITKASTGNQNTTRKIIWEDI